MLVNVIILIIGIATRVPFVARYLYNWDSPQFALALENYEIAFHQPHPPGYYFYVFTAKLINCLVNDANRAFIIENIILGALASVFFYQLALLFFHKDKNKARWSAAFFIFNPVIWFYGEIAAVYVVDLCLGAALAVLMWRIVFGQSQKQRRDLFMMAITLGVATGFRQTFILFYAPLAAWTVYIYWRDKKGQNKDLIWAGGWLLFSLATWIGPMVYLAGGGEKYFDLVYDQFKLAGQTTSLFQKASWLAVGAQIKKLIKALIILANFFGLFGLVGLVKIYQVARGKEKINKRRTIFFALWLGPSLFVYGLMHFAQIGYLFTIAPAVLLMLYGWCFAFCERGKKKGWYLCGLLLILQVAIFWGGWEAFKPKTSGSWFRKSYEAAVDYRISPNQLDVPGIQKNDQKIEKALATIRQYEPKETAVVTEYASPYFNYYENWATNYRIMSYYLPEYLVYEIFWGEKKEYFQTQEHSLARFNREARIVLPADVRYLIFVNQRTKMEMPKELKTGQASPEGIYAMDLAGIAQVEYIGYKFIIKNSKTDQDKQLGWNPEAEAFDYQP